MSSSKKVNTIAEYRRQAAREKAALYYAIRRSAKEGKQ